jgi:DinB superfamily
MARPNPDEYLPYYEQYISLVPENDILAVLQKSLCPLFFLTGVPESEATIRHPPYTWTIKQVVGHLTDSERVFGYRALRIARGDTTPLPGFDENTYAKAGGHDQVHLSALVIEYEALRRSHIMFFENLPQEAWLRRGVANNAEVSVHALAYILIGHERHHGAIIRKRLGME